MAGLYATWAALRDLNDKTTASAMELDGQEIYACTSDAMEVGKTAFKTAPAKFGNKGALESSGHQTSVICHVPANG